MFSRFCREQIKCKSRASGGTWERLFLQSPLRFRRMSGSFYVLFSFLYYAVFCAAIQVRSNIFLYQSDQPCAGFL